MTETRPYTLWGMPGSLYTGKARAYLRRCRLPFVERPPGDPEFSERVRPEIGRWIIPVLETPEGEIVQDGSAIIDFLEARHAPERPARPENPALAALAHLFELFGGEGMLRAAMHYRWNFDAENVAFLEEDFSRALAPPLADAQTRKAVFDFSSGRMRKACASFGVNDATKALVESSYGEFLRLFEAHLEAHTYVLGGRATHADYGLFNPLFAHLARDPKPAALMKRTALLVWRWTERMNAPHVDMGHYGVAEAPLFKIAAVPETLKALMRFVAEDFFPELAAHVAFANDWLAARPDLPEGDLGVDKPSRRAIGAARFQWRGADIETPVMPYRFWLLQRMQDTAGAADETDRAALDALLAETGLSAMLALRTARRVERQGHAEVWGAAA